MASRNSMASELQKDITARIKRDFPEALQGNTREVFDEMDLNKDGYLCKNDLKESVKKVFRMTNLEDAKMSALIDKLFSGEENDRGLDFPSFLMHFDLHYRPGPWSQGSVRHDAA